MDGMALGGAAAPFLGIERSVCGRRWHERAADPGLAAMIAERHGLPEIVGRLLAQRGIGVAEAPEAGLDVIVIDHHVTEPLLPRALALVNPNRLDETSPHGALAAVGVAFLLVVALNRALREAGWYRARAEPDLLQWLDLVALGTVC